MGKSKKAGELKGVEMLKDLSGYFSSYEFVKDVLLIFIGALITYIWNIMKEKKRNIMGKRAVKKTTEDFMDDGIISLANAYPSYDAQNIRLEDTGEKFFLSLPAGYENTFSCREKDCIFDGSSLQELGHDMRIEEFDELVEKHRLIVANEFIGSENGGRRLFNNEKYGIRTINITKTDDKDENDVLVIHFYLTDYFTHRVMRSVYRELRDSNHPIAGCTRVEDLQAYYPFLTSFGIDSLLCLTLDNGMDALVLVKRSKYMANMDRDRWHVTMNEGLSTTDLDAVSGKVSFNQSVERGYLEELGISYNNHKIRNEFRDVFLVHENFEIGITTLAKVKMSIEDFETCFKGAEDSSMESTGAYKVVSLTPADIKKTMRENRNEMTDVCKYCLRMCLSRMV